MKALFVRVNNCVGENKNYILVGYVGSLVGRGIMDTRTSRSIRSFQGQIFRTLLQRTIARRSVCVRAEVLFLLKIYHPLQAPVKNRDPV